MLLKLQDLSHLLSVPRIVDLQEGLAGVCGYGAVRCRHQCISSTLYARHVRYRQVVMFKVLLHVRSYYRCNESNQEQLWAPAQYSSGILVIRITRKYTGDYGDCPAGSSACSMADTKKQINKQTVTTTTATSTL